MIGRLYSVAIGSQAQTTAKTLVEVASAADSVTLIERISITQTSPEKVAISWKARRKDLGQLWGLWETLVETIDPYHPMYLAIDSKGRDAALRSISKTLELDIKTDWPIVASTGLTAVLTKEEANKASQYVEFYASKRTCSFS